MKILWLSHLVPYPPNAGVLIRAYNLIKELSKYHDVTLVAFNQERLMRSFYDDPEKGLEEATSELRKYCSDIKILPIESEQRASGNKRLAAKSIVSKDCYTVNWLKSRSAREFLSKLNQSQTFDAIHFDTISLAPYCEIFGNIPKILDHHNIESSMMLRRASIEKNLLKKLYFAQEGYRLRNYEKRVCTKFDVNITCSELDTSRLKQLDPSLKIVEIENGVDLEFFDRNGVANIPSSAIFVGTMNWYPNVEAVRILLKDIWPLVVSIKPSATLELVGANPPSHIIELACNTPGARVHGFVEDVRPFIEQASVYVCPINDGGGTKLKILDAFAMQSAVVCNPIACEGIYAQNEVDVLFANSANDFSQKILDLFDDDERRREIGINARRLVTDKYSFHSIGERLAVTFENLVKKNQRVDS